MCMGYGHVQLWLITNRGFEGNANIRCNFLCFFCSQLQSTCSDIWYFRWLKCVRSNFESSCICAHMSNMFWVLWFICVHRYALWYVIIHHWCGGIKYCRCAVFNICVKKWSKHETAVSNQVLLIKWVKLQSIAKLLKWLK